MRATLARDVEEGRISAEKAAEDRMKLEWRSQTELTQDILRGFHQLGY